MTSSPHGPLSAQVVVTGSALSFARAMRELDGDAFDWLYFLDKPHKWQDDYAFWAQCGGPTSDADPAWDRWANLQLQRNTEAGPV